MEPTGTIEPYKHYLRPEGCGLKLHLGCGDYWFDGFINIDLEVFGGTDMLLDIRKGLPFQNETVQTIEAHDFFEHLSQDELEGVLDDVFRVLIQGGNIIVTVPDMEEVVKEYVNNIEEALQAIYGFGGDHKWGYTKKSFRELFEKHGFRNVQITEPMFKKDQYKRIQLEAIK